MLGHGVGPALIVPGIVLQRARDGEEQGGVAGPDRRHVLPDALHAVGAEQVVNLRTDSGNIHLILIVLQVNHVIVPRFIHIERGFIIPHPSPKSNVQKRARAE